MQNSIDTFNNLYYEYWDLLTKFLSGSFKWNQPFDDYSELETINTNIKIGFSVQLSIQEIKF